MKMQDLDGASTLDSATQKDKDAEQLEMMCQNPKCRSKLRAARVCHHSDCRDVNNQRPLQLCLECDREIHGQRFRSGHLCFDIPKKRGQFSHNAVLTEKRDQESGNRRTWSEGDMNTNQKLQCCDTLNKQDNRQVQYEKCDSSSRGEQQQSNINDGISKKNHCGTDSRSINEDHRNSNDQQCRSNGESSNNKQHLNSAVGELSNRESSNDLHSDSFRQLSYRRSYSHNSLCETDVRNRNLHKNNENSRKDQLNDHLFDKSHFENSNESQHLDSDHLGNNGQSDTDQLDNPSDSDELNDRCYGNCNDCGKNKNNHGSIRNKPDHQSCDEDSWTANSPQLETTSQDFDVDSTDPESDSWSHKLIRKKAMKIRKPKALASVLKRPAQELNPSDGVRSPATEGYGSNVKHKNPDDEIKPTCPPTKEFSKAKRTSIDMQQDYTEPWICTQKPPFPKRYSDIAEHDVEADDKLTNGNLKASRPLQYSVDNLTNLSSSKASNMSENSRTRYVSSSNLQSSGVQDESRKKPFGTRILGSTKLQGGEFFRKFSLTSEYFTLRFGADEQMVVAPKGLSLGRAISSIITEKWGLTLDQCDIFLNSSNSALPLSSDCYLLANNTLFVRVKLDERKNGIKIIHLNDSYVSPSTPVLIEKGRQNGNIKISRKSVSSEDCISTDALSSYPTLSQSDLQKLRNAKGPSKLQSLFQSSKLQDKQEQLVDLLNGYSTNGLPKMPDLLTLGRQHYDSSIFHLEKHWKDIVNGHESLTKHQRDQQEAIWELLTTEVEYIRKLHVVIDLFMCCLFNLQNEQILNEIEADKLFSNIDDVYYATCHFWNVHMSQVLQRARETREPLNPSLLKSGFHVFDKIFEPYTKYCLEQDLCQDYIRSITKENELFRIYIQWGQSQKQCRLLRLQDIMCGPWQRLMRYRLLLKEILKYTELFENPTPDDQINDLENMIDQVEKFVTEVNVAMRHREESRLMSKLMNRIESYDVVEAPNEECIKLLDKFSKLDLISPVAGCGSREMRMLLFEGGLRLKDAFSKMDVYCFLFTDLFLITKPVTKRGGDKVKVIKPPMRLDKIVVHKLQDQASFVVLYLNEYHVAQAIYTFHGDSRLWTESLKKAQNDYKDKRYQYLMRPDGVFMDNNDDEDDNCATLAESPLTGDSGRDFLSLSRSNSYSSADTFLPNYTSELSLLSAVDPPKDDFRTCGLQRRRGLSTNPRLNGSCDQLVLGRKETYPYMLKKSCLSTPLTGTGLKALKSDGTSMEDLTNHIQNDEKTSAGVNVRHHSEGVGRKRDKEAYIKKRLSWNNETPGSCSAMREPFSRNRNQAMSRSKSPATGNTRRSATDLESSIVQRPADTENSELPHSRISSSVFRNGHDISRTANHIRASMPVFPKGAVMDSTVIDKTLEIKETPSTARRHLVDNTFLLEDCTLEATDV